jgi:hypothetical protein
VRTKPVRPQTPSLYELLIDSEGDRNLRPVLVGMLRETPTAIRRTGSPRRTASRGLDSDRESLAGLSCCEDDVTESFLHYKTALDLGGLGRPGSRLTALDQARRPGEPVSTSARILADASGLERVALRTASSRAAGCAGLALVVLGWVLAIFGKVLLGAVSVGLACAQVG